MNFIKLCLQTTLITKHDICLPAMCQTVNFHLTMMRASKLGIMVCALQYKCLQTPFNQSLRTLQPFSLLLFTSLKS